MAHTAPPLATRRPAELVLGTLLLLAGVSLAFLAYSALGHPDGRQAGGTLLHPLATPPSLAAGPAAAGASRPATGGSAQASPSPAAGSTNVAATAAAGTPLVVLDNTGRPQLARLASERFRQGGWTVTDTSTFDGDILSTAAYYDPAAPGAQAAAEALQAQFPEIQRVKPKFDGLGPGPIVVVLTHDYSQAQTIS